MGGNVNNTFSTNTTLPLLTPIESILEAIPGMFCTKTKNDPFILFTDERKSQLSKVIRIKKDRVNTAIKQVCIRYGDPIPYGPELSVGKPKTLYELEHMTHQSNRPSTVIIQAQLKQALTNYFNECPGTYV